MWKWVLQVAIMLGKSEWAKAYAKRVIEHLRRQVDSEAQAIAQAVGIAVPPVAEIRQGRIIRTKTDMLKPEQVVLVDGQRFRISRLISSSATETVYEAEAVQ